MTLKQLNNSRLGLKSIILLTICFLIGLYVCYQKSTNGLSIIDSVWKYCHKASASEFVTKWHLRGKNILDSNNKNIFVCPEGEDKKYRDACIKSFNLLKNSGDLNITATLVLRNDKKCTGFQSWLIHSKEEFKRIHSDIIEQCNQFESYNYAPTYLKLFTIVAICSLGFFIFFILWPLPSLPSPSSITKPAIDSPEKVSPSVFKSELEIEKRYSEDLRPNIARIFVPGLYLCLLLSIFLSGFVALVACTIIYFIFSIISIIPTGMILLIFIGGLAGILYSLLGIWNSFKKPQIYSPAILVNNDLPKLTSFIQDLCEDMKTRMPDSIILEMGNNFYVTQSPVKSFSGNHTNRTLCISLPLLRFLKKHELKAILAHELAHFTGNDVEFSEKFYPIYRGVLSTIYGMSNITDSSSGNSSAISIPLIIPIIILKRYLSYFMCLEKEIGRQRELRADSIASLKTSPLIMASALVKIYAYGMQWSMLASKLLTESNKGEKGCVNIPMNFHTALTEEDISINETIKTDSMLSSNPTDSHPSLYYRLKCLNEDNLKRFYTDGEDATSLIPNLEDFECKLSNYLIPNI